MNDLKHKAIAFLTAFLAAIIFTPWTFAQGGRYDDWHMGPGMMGTWGMGWFGGIFMIFFWVLIIVALILAIRWLFQVTGRSRPDESSGDRALEILKERCARGEINRSEFEAMKKDLA